MAVESRAAANLAKDSPNGGPTVMNVTSPATLQLLDAMPAEVRSDVARARSETVSKLWMATEKMNILYPENWTRRAAEELLWFQVAT